MEFPDPLIKGRLVRRYKRFMADVELDDGSVVVAHCANSGSMLSVNLPGSEVWISPARNPDRKLRYTWEMARIGSTLVGINTGWPNALAAEAIAAGKVPELAGYASLRREVKYGRNSRIDLLLEDPERPKCYVEVKNVTMRRDLSDGAPVEFPDGVTARGTKHLGELADMVAEAQRAGLRACTVRLSNVFGSTSDHADRVVPAFARAAACLTRPRARRKGRGKRSSPIAKLRRLRSVWAPQ